MATDVFHMDANGVRISVDRAVFANHTYATRNISSVAAIADKGVRWPGIFTMVLGIGLLIGGFVFSHTFTLILGVGGVLSGSLNLSRKRPKYGLRIITQRGPVYVLASPRQAVRRDSLDRAAEGHVGSPKSAPFSRRWPFFRHPHAPFRHSRAGGNLAALPRRRPPPGLPRRRWRRSGRPSSPHPRAPSSHSRAGGNLAPLPPPPLPAVSQAPPTLGRVAWSNTLRPSAITAARSRPPSAVSAANRSRRRRDSEASLIAPRW